MIPQVDKANNKKNKGKSPIPKQDKKKLEVEIPPVQKYKNGTIIQNYQIVEFIQMGAYGQVFKVRGATGKNDLNLCEESLNRDEPKNETGNEQIYAMKCIDKQNIGTEELKRLIIEKEIMSKINHENIVQLHDFFDLEGYNDYFMILDYCEGEDLQCEVNAQLCFEVKRIEESAVISYLAQLLRGFKLLRWYKIMHRDMKPENVLKNDVVSNHIQICDFGLINFGTDNAMTAAGTKYYVAPEICDIYEMEEKEELKKGKRKTSCEVENILLSHSFSQTMLKHVSQVNGFVDLEYDSKVDIFGIACVIYECLFLTRVLKVKKGDNPIFELKNAYKKTGKDLYFPPTTKCSDIMKDLLIQMTEPDSSKRITWENLFRHTVVKNYSLQYDFDEAIKKKCFVEVIDAKQKTLSTDDIKNLTDPYPLNFPCESVDISINDQDSLGTLFKVTNDYFKELNEHIKKTKSYKKIDDNDLNNKKWIVVIYPHTAQKKKQTKKKGNAKDEKNYLIVFVDKKPIDLYIEFHNKSSEDQDYFKVSDDYSEREHVWTLEPNMHKRFCTDECITWEIYKSNGSVMVDADFNENVPLACLKSTSQKSIHPEDPTDSIYPLYSMTTPLSKDEFVDKIIRLETIEDFKMKVEKIKKTKDTSNSNYKHDPNKKKLVRSPLKRKLSKDMEEIQSESDEKSNSFCLKDDDDKFFLEKNSADQSTDFTHEAKTKKLDEKDTKPLLEDIGFDEEETKKLDEKDPKPLLEDCGFEGVTELQNELSTKLYQFSHYDIQLRFLFNTYEEFYIFVKQNEIFKREYGVQALLILNLLLNKASVLKNGIQTKFSQIDDKEKMILCTIEKSINIFSKELSDLKDELHLDSNLNDYHKSLEKIDKILKEALLSIQSYSGEETCTIQELDQIKDHFSLVISKVYIAINLKEYFINQNNWDHVWENNFNWSSFDYSYDKQYIREIIKNTLKFISFNNIKIKSQQCN